MTSLKLGTMFAVVAATLGACGNSGEQDASRWVLRSAAGLIAPSKAPAAAVSRNALAALGVPVIVGKMKSENSTYYFAPLAQTGGVETWTTSDDFTISLRGGVLAETRGLGPDIIESRTPSLEQLRGGRGTTVRSYGYLAGGDQILRANYTCSLSSAGMQSVTVFDRQQSATKVTEVCQADQGGFQNEYWFNSSGKLVKSTEHMAPGTDALVLSRVIDK